MIFPECLDMSPYMSSNRSTQPNVPTESEDPVAYSSENKLVVIFSLKA